jgi:pimeloyl-ACP methyl ester carboxylesterase
MARWTGTKDDYVAWLIEQIEAEHARTGPVHIVGHDWGCLLVLRAASLCAERLRSVAAGNGHIDPRWPLHGVWARSMRSRPCWMPSLDSTTCRASNRLCGGQRWRARACGCQPRLLSMKLKVSRSRIAAHDRLSVWTNISSPRAVGLANAHPSSEINGGWIMPTQ